MPAMPHPVPTAWFDGPLGRHVFAAEQAAMDQALTQAFGFLLVQVGHWGEPGALLRGSRVPRRLFAATAPAPEDAVLCEPSALPFPANSVDVVVLPHTLERVAEPHAVVREAERVLVGEGHLVVLGFNPWSAWGLKRALGRDRFPCDAQHCITESRLGDWLELLDFEVEGVTRLLHRPPIDHAGYLARSAWLERTGARLWPALNGAYLLVARKRVYGMTPLRLKRREAPGIGALVNPVARFEDAA
jgi:SAM-dependent methyltransferase